MSTSKKIQKSDAFVLKWIIGVCKSQIVKIVALVVINAVLATMSVLFANFSKHIIDGAVTYHDMNYVIKYAVLFLFILAVRVSLSMFSNALTERCSGRIEMLLKKEILDVIMRKDYSAVTAFHTGELQNRMFNDVRIISENFTTILPNLVSFVVRILSALIYLLVAVDKIFALFFVVGAFLVFLCTRLFRKKLKSLHKEVQESEGKTRSFIQEAITNLLVIKSFVVEDKIDATTDELQENNYKSKMKRKNFLVSANGSLSAVFNLAFIVSLVFGAYKLYMGAMTYGTVTAMLQIVNQIQGPVVSLSGIMPKYYSLIASGERLIDLEKLPDEEENNNGDIDISKTYDSLAAISFDNISFKYDRDIVLDNTSLTIKKGDFVAIMGISGIGKSTLLKLLLGVFNVQSGKISLKLDSGEIPIDRHTRRMFSYVPQGNMLISGTIRDNLTFINENATDSEIENAVKISCAKRFIDELPLGLDTVIGEKGMGLSEGQIQRLAIARSLLSNSPILLLDEATSALDEATEKEFLTNLKQVKNVTCIIVSHKKAALEICNKRIQIIDGKIISEG